MKQGHWRISRRRFLRGAGAAIALPTLDAMIPAGALGASAAKPPTRMACIYFPNGVWQDSWIPKQTGSDFEFPRALKPLEGLKDQLLILSGLDKAASRQGDGHYAKTANFLTGEPVTKTTGREISAGGISMDQLAAQKLGAATPLPSLELGIDPVISGVDSNVGYTRLYGSYISWRSPTLPVAKEINPRFVYERLFGEKDAGGREIKSNRRREDDRSLLDLALEDANQLRGKLGRDDQFKLDEYLDSIRALEKRIEFASKPDGRTWKPAPMTNSITPPPEKIPSDFREHIKLMLDLMVLAFQTDSTRIVSFMFANDVSPRNFSFLPGVEGGHHDMSHHSNEPKKIEAYTTINRWHAGQFAYLLDRLRSIREGDETLLDHSMILFGSSISDGNRHDPNNLPILLGGRGGGMLKSGMHLAHPKDTPLCNLYVSMLKCFGAPVESFGDSNGALDVLA